MGIYKRGGVWWIDLHRNGRRIRRTAGTQDKARAQEIHDKLAASVHRVQRGERTLSDAMLLWLDDRPRSARDESMVRIIRQHYPNRPLPMVTQDSVRDAFKAMPAGTANRYASIIKRALRLASDRGWIDRVPRLPMRSGATQKTRFLTDDEVARLIGELPSHLRAPARFALATGLRSANVTGLQWHQIDLDRGVAWFTPEQMKAKKALTVPLSSNAIAILKAQPSRSGAVFRYNGKSFKIATDTVKRAAARAKLDGVTWHTLRHTWASNHVRNGTPLEVLRALGGWSNIGMVMRYAHLAPSYVAQWAGNAVQTPTQAARDPLG